MLSIQDFTRKTKSQSEIGLKVFSEEEIKQIQKILLEMYKDMISVCEKYKITLFLGGGSALGAIRHKGFIPWDEDMDFNIPREDYLKFIECFTNEYSSKYDIVSTWEKSENIGFITRIFKKDTLLVSLFDLSNIGPSGIYVDIFIIDYVPRRKVERLFHGFISNCYIYVLNSVLIYKCRNEYSDRFFSLTIKSRSFYYFRILIGMLFSIFAFRKLCLSFDRWISMFFKKSNLVTIPTGRNHYFGEMHSQDVFYPAKKVSFGGIDAFVPNKVDIYLRKLYGDNYMQVPPPEKREPHACIALKIK